MKSLSILFALCLLWSCEAPDPKEQESEPEPKVEKVTETYDNGFLKIRGTLIDGKRSGLWEAYYPTGYRWSEVKYLDGVREGSVITYYPNGMMHYEGKYSAGKRSGSWTFYDTTGVLVRRIDMANYREDTLLNHPFEME